MVLLLASFPFTWTFLPVAVNEGSPESVQERSTEREAGENRVKQNKSGGWEVGKLTPGILTPTLLHTQCVGGHWPRVLDIEVPRSQWLTAEQMWGRPDARDASRFPSAYSLGTVCGVFPSAEPMHLFAIHFPRRAYWWSKKSFHLNRRVQHFSTFFS